MSFKMDERNLTPLVYGLAAIGTLFLSSYALSFVRVLLSLFVLPGTSLSAFGRKGSWAVVTGASDGIGKEYAMQLARKGFNVLLVSRTESKLKTLAEEISAKYSVETLIHAMDYSKNSESDYKKLSALIESNGLDDSIAILINNVGQSHSIPVPFLETTKKEMTDIVTINVFGTLRTTQLIAPYMVRKGRGLILTMASFGGLTPTPFLATYSGSKAFLQQWSTALGAELAPHGVTVQLVQSYLVTSAMSKIRRTSATTPSPRAFVSAALAKIGRSGGAQGIGYTASPYWSHGIIHWALQTFTGTMNKTVVAFNLKMHQHIRKRALRKAEREAKKAS